jgi:hypothetical protein
MKSMEIPNIEFPDDVQAKIRALALKTNSSEEEVVARLMQGFFDLVDDSGKQDVPALVKKVREALLNDSGPSRD